MTSSPSSPPPAPAPPSSEAAPPDPASAAPASALVPPLTAAGLGLLLEYGGAAARESLPGGLGLAVWALAAFALLAAAALTLDGLFAALARVLARLPGLRRPLARLATSRLGAPLAALALTAAIAAWVADLTLFPRLYPGYHAALGLAGLTAALAALHLAARRAAPLRPRRALHHALAALAAAAIAHGALAARDDARATLLDDGVWAADIAWLGAWATDLDRDGAGVLFTGADAHPLDPDRALADPCLAPRAVPPAAPPIPTPTATPTNLLLITIDALRADHAPPDGARFMPSLARFAEGAVTFRAAYAPAAMTIPSIAALHTGRYPWALAWTPTAIDVDDRVRYDGPAQTWPRAWPGGTHVATPARDRHPTLAERLTAAGHATLGLPPHENFLAPFGLGRGFTDYPASIVRDHNPRGVAITGGIVADHAISYIAAQRDRPWFVWAHLFDPHNPYRWPPGTDTTDDTDLARYRAEILYTDVQIARMLVALDRAGLADRTIVVVTADHGESFGDHGANYHSTGLYDELTRVPLLIRAPGLAPRVIDDPVSLVDVAPTLGGLLDLPPLPTTQGRDLAPLLRGHPAPPAPILAEVAYRDYHRTYMLRDGDHKLIWDHHRDTRRLYDLAADPRETRNRVDLDPERAAAMTARLCAALRSTDGLTVPPAPPSPPVPLYGDPAP